mgnify:CR=1 FL=1
MEEEQARMEWLEQQADICLVCGEPYTKNGLIVCDNCDAWADVVSEREA